ncbi:UDP-N-acetylglucosamine 2-epimerase [Catalinimonas sp. 4WD22]|uniref:UDP-N-acetylglucosamine 2-epimerase n=1 Tax=Catalinimonas locisalis TaxID=3133978 RepID=UPI0031014F58
MINRRKICVVTGTRAEYGLLYWVIKNLYEDADVDLQLIVTGMHLSPEFGLTYQEIEKDGFPISKKLEILLSSDTPAGISKAIGLGNIAFADAFAELKPDIVLLLGDRFEILAAATAALVSRIPIAHCHGGELTTGAMDDAFRHAITKMSHIHFTATEVYRARVVRLGEQPTAVHNVGGLGIENVHRLKLLNKREFEESISFKLKERNLLITFHPVTLEHATAGQQLRDLLRVLDELPKTGLIFTMPNADTDGRVIITMIQEYVQKHPEKAVAFKSLGQLRYLSALKYVDAVVGNSSSGLLEAPSFKVGTINIGDRQEGRVKADSVINCAPDYQSLKKAFDKLYSADFQTLLTQVTNPYDQGNASGKICHILKYLKLDSLLKKVFYDG